MNSRLMTLYEQIEHDNRQKFLDNELFIDTSWGKNVFGVTMQIDIDDYIKNAIDHHIQNLKRLDSQNLLFSDRRAQHISFNQVVQWNLGTQEENQAMWGDIKYRFLQKFSGFNQKFFRFTITFEKIIATTGGIIWCASDLEDEMERTRDILLAHLPKPTVIPKPIHIIHTTIARYKKHLINPSRIFEYIQGESVPIQMEVRRIILRKELVYPTLNTEEIASIELFK